MPQHPPNPGQRMPQPSRSTANILTSRKSRTPCQRVAAHGPRGRQHPITRIPNTYVRKARGTSLVNGSPLTESNHRPSPYHGPPGSPCNRCIGPEQASRWLALAPTGRGKPSLAAFCPPKCPRNNLPGEEPGGTRLGDRAHVRFSIVACNSLRLARCATEAWSAQAGRCVSVGDPLADQRVALPMDGAQRPILDDWSW